MSSPTDSPGCPAALSRTSGRLWNGTTWTSPEQRTAIRPLITGTAEVIAEGQLFVRPPQRFDDGVDGDNE
ncbi:MAG: hypothetical protein OXB92_05945 [Acidimicrobiaceae bacterium]|nr:hypothetical protein [Acidimicrobiaceae bacterium]